MNPLLLPEYLVERFRKLGEKIGATYERIMLDIIMAIGLLIFIVSLLSGALYVSTYLESVPWLIDLTRYGYGIYFFMPRAIGDPLSQTAMETIYISMAYFFGGLGAFVLWKGSKTILQRNTVIIFGISLVAISMLMLLVLDYLKLFSLR
ncbi:MAG: hypothetical protein ACUVQ0_00545 [Thermoproteota archaeon]